MKLEQLMNQQYHTFNENERFICGYLLRHQSECAGMTIEEMAAACHVSKTSLFRFAKKLTLSGFSELRARLRLESEERPEGKTDLLLAAADSCHKMIHQMESLNCHSLFEKLLAARRVLVFGSGYAQARVASEMKRIFLPIKRKIYTMHGSDMVEPLIRMAVPSDFVVLISLSGESQGIVRLAETLRMKQIFTVSITRFSNNTLAGLCDENLYINTIPIPLGPGIDYEISTPYFILLELLFLKYQCFLEEIQQD